MFDQSHKWVLFCWQVGAFENLWSPSGARIGNSKLHRAWGTEVGTDTSGLSTEALQGDSIHFINWCWCQFHTYTRACCNKYEIHTESPAIGGFVFVEEWANSKSDRLLTVDGISLFLNQHIIFDAVKEFSNPQWHRLNIVSKHVNLTQGALHGAQSGWECVEDLCSVN